MRRSRSAGSLFLGDDQLDDWSSELPCLASYDEWSSELPCMAAFESSSSCLDDTSRRHSMLSNDSSTGSSAAPVETSVRRRRTCAATGTLTKKMDRAARVRQKLANAQDVKRTMNVYRRANRDVVMSDSSARRDAEAVDETLKAMEGLMKTLQVGTKGATRRRSKVLLA